MVSIGPFNNVGENRQGRTPDQIKQELYAYVNNPGYNNASGADAMRQTLLQWLSGIIPYQQLNESAKMLVNDALRGTSWEKNPQAFVQVANSGGDIGPTSATTVPGTQSAPGNLPMQSYIENLLGQNGSQATAPSGSALSVGARGMPTTPIAGPPKPAPAALYDPAAPTARPDARQLPAFDRRPGQGFTPGEMGAPAGPAPANSQQIYRPENQAPQTAYPPDYQPPAPNGINAGAAAVGTASTAPAPAPAPTAAPVVNTQGTTPVANQVAPQAAGGMNPAAASFLVSDPQAALAAMLSQAGYDPTHLGIVGSYAAKLLQPALAATQEFLPFANGNNPLNVGSQQVANAFGNVAGMLKQPGADIEAYVRNLAGQAGSNASGVQNYLGLLNDPSGQKQAQFLSDLATGRTFGLNDLVTQSAQDQSARLLPGYQVAAYQQAQHGGSDLLFSQWLAQQPPDVQALFIGK